MNKFKSIYSAILGCIQLFVLSMLPIWAYSKAALLVSRLWNNTGIYPIDPIVIAVIVLIINVVICVVSEIVLYRKETYKSSIIYFVIQIFAWLVSFVIAYYIIVKDWNNWGSILYAVSYIINFIFVMISSLIGIYKAKKRL